MLKITHRPNDDQPPVKVSSPVDPSRLEHWVRRFAVPRHYVAEAEVNRRVGAELAELLAGLGYAVTMNGPFGNVVAKPPQGGARPVLVATHYDSVPGCPAADDNGSGMAVVLHLAEILRARNGRVHFALFNREEDGLLGSQGFVAREVAAQRMDYAEVHVLEMVGYRARRPGSQRPPPGLPVSVPTVGDFLGLLGNRDSNDIVRDLVKLAKRLGLDVPVIGLQVLLGAEKHAPVLLRSDHAPFWEARVPAVMWTDTAEYRNPHYHQPTDLPETLDYDFMAAVTRLLLERVTG